MKTIEVINNKDKVNPPSKYIIGSYKYDGETLTLFNSRGNVLRTYLPEEFTGFKVNACRPSNLPTQ